MASGASPSLPVGLLKVTYAHIFSMSYSYLALAELDFGKRLGEKHK